MKAKSQPLSNPTLNPKPTHKNQSHPPPPSLPQLRSRIHKILDEQFGQVFSIIEKRNQVQDFTRGEEMGRVVINQSMLQEWVQMFRHQVLIVRGLGREESGNGQGKVQRLKFPEPYYEQEQTEEKILCHVDGNKLNVFWYNQQVTTQQQLWTHTPYTFPQSTIKPYTSITVIPHLHQLILIGGCKPTNPNIKSSKILSLSLKTSHLSSLSNLPYGLSSHSTVYHPQTNSIYIIGGNRNHSVVTRGCFRLGLGDRKVEEVTCLNYPVSSATCVVWKKRWIYKFGGVGEAFGEWGTSPYIQRYEIEKNEWEVVNPRIGPNITPNLSFNNMFLAHSTAYISSDPQKIFVFGGYSIQGEFKNYGFLLGIDDHDEGDDEENNQRHVIEEYGKVEMGDKGWLGNSVLVGKNFRKETCLFGLMRLEDTGSVEPTLIHRFSK